MNILYLIIEIIFWLCVFFVFHTYLLFPLLLKILAHSKNQNNNVFAHYEIETLPTVSIIFAAYNEELLIVRKLESIYNTNYPLHKIEVLVGSDNSTDSTNSLIQNFAQHHPSLQLHVFASRTGKIGIINELTNKATGEILVMTDANVFFYEHTLYHLVKHYKNNDIHLVGGLIQNTNIKKDGISFQERTYLSNENILKYNEGILWGCMIGTFGGAYSIRKNSYSKVPANFVVDDFFITMSVLQHKGSAIQELEAICCEDVSNELSEEFRRKTRISVGNFQNLKTFWRLAFPIYSGRGFCFISHKILRWFTPFFLICTLLCSGVLSFNSSFYLSLFISQLFLFVIPILDGLLKKIAIHIVFLRFITHFYTMNLALLIGFIKFVKGVESNVWQPTKRNQ